MEHLRRLIRTIAAVEPTDASPAPPVLILGETGTGKELVARACHHSGPRAKSPFIEVNCAALPAHLIEGELFGFEKGAFTDAHARKIGLIEAADGGTLFLDEIGELDLGLQAKLLRVLEDYRVRRLGALSDRQVNVRIVAATNRDLDVQVREGRFRADLMYRLKVFQIQVPPLRERREDIAALAGHFLAQLANRYGRAQLALDEGALGALEGHDWPGNVRELRNVLERAVLMQRTGSLSELSLNLGPSARSEPPSALLQQPGGDLSLDAMEREHMQRALETSGRNVSKAAALLGISRDTLRYRMERHGLRR
jgi:two-component system, NtrC family, response regulator AtoC